MRLALAQLKKLSMPYHCSEELDLTAELIDFEDIVSVDKAKINYTIYERGVETYEVSFNYTINLVMVSAISLKDVPYTINGKDCELFSTNPDLEDAFMIDYQTLDTKEAILTSVLINKPMRIVLDGESFESCEEASEEKINPAFAKLKDLYEEV